MTVPSYTEDLTDIATGDEAAGWVELSGTDQDGYAYNAMGAPAYEDNEYPYIQGPYAVTQDCTKSTAVGSMAYSSGGITIPTDGAVFVWHNFSSPLAFGTYAQGGYRIVLGSGLADFDVWYVGGNDKGRSPYGGFENHVVNPTVTRDNWAGTATGTIDYVASAVYVISGPSKGEPHQADVMRYGRGSAIFEYGEIADYATIEGFSIINDNQNNRWGLIQATPGGFLWKGRMQLGSVTNPVDFRDSGKIMFIDWTPKVTSNFNLIDIVNASSNVEMTGFTFICLDTSTASRGRLLMTDPADVALTSCTFFDMDTFVFSYDTTNVVDIVTCSFNRCGLVTIGGASFVGCLFEEPSGTISVFTTTLDDLSGCVFNSDGTGHGVDLGTITSTQSMSWDCTDTGYTASSSGNETILVSVDNGITLTINVSDTATTPSVYNTGTGTVNVVAGQKTFAFTVNPSITGYEWRLYDVNATGSLTGAIELDGEETATADNQSYSYTYTVDDAVAVQIIDDNYVESVTYYTFSNANQSVTINLSTEENT